MIDIALMRKGSIYVPFSEDDRQAGLIYPEQQILRARISGSKKPRSYKELSFYMSSCGYISGLDHGDINLSSKEKVDYKTRLDLDFIYGTVFTKNGLLHWIPHPLNYDNCDQPKAHRFISTALWEHAFFIGMPDVESYKRLLESQ